MKLTRVIILSLIAVPMAAAPQASCRRRLRPGPR